MAWTVPDLTPAGNPVLEAGETLLRAAEGVTLYDGDVRSDAHAEGTAFLTSRRVVYVDAADPLRHSAAAALRDVAACEYTARFLAASAKVRLRLAPPDAAADAAQRAWLCPICSFRNDAAGAPGGELPVCATCGVRAAPDVFAAAAPPPEARMTAAPGECPQCTFQNHASLAFCEMCGARLRAEPRAAPALGRDVRLSFRRGGSHAFFAALDAQLRAGAAAPPREEAPAPRAAPPSAARSGFGIEKLEQHTQQTRDATNELLAAAFASPAALRAHARELLAVAAHVGGAAAPGGAPGGAAVPSVVVRGAPPQPAAALAKEIADFCVGADVLARSGDMLTLHDLFARYNRARGLRLVAPAELLQALELCEALDLPIRVRTRGALRVVVARGEKDRALTKLMRWIAADAQQPWRAAAGFSARDVHEHLGWSMPIATEELLAAEAEGALCRDEHISGLRFFPNQFAPHSAA